MSMNPKDLVHVEEIPELRKPVIIAAFGGWNDASQVATHALETLVTAWSARHFAQIDPEVFFDFTETRPTISLEADGHRSLEWPSNYVFSHRLEERNRDVVLLVGTEPQLRWRTFCGVVLHLADQIGASTLITLGGLLADVPHTADPRITGFATTKALLRQLQKLGVRMSSYEGPTGIVGTLHDAWHNTGRPAASLWGNVPHYISATPNPGVSLALLRGLSSLLSTPLPLSGLETQADAFRVQVDQALQENPEAVEYVQQLEQQFASESPANDGPELINELEEFLRKRRPQSDEEPK